MEWAPPDVSRLDDDGPPPVDVASFSWLGRFLGEVARVCYRVPWLVLLAGMILGGLALFYTVTNLEINQDRGSLIGTDDPFYVKQQGYNREFPYPDDMLVIVEGEDTRERETFVDELSKELEGDRHFQRVFGRLVLPFLKDRALYYLDVSSLKNLVESLAEARPLLRALSSTEGLSSLLDSFNSEIEAGGGSLANMLPFLNEVLGQLYVSLETRGRFEYGSPWGALFFGGQENVEGVDAPRELEEPGQTVFYNTVADGQIHLLLVQPNGAAGGDPIRLLRRKIDWIQKAHPKLRIGLTGEGVLEYDETRSSTEDSIRSTMLSLVLVALLFGFAFRQLLRPLAGMVALVLAISWSLGFTTLAIGHLNLLTVTFATLLVGLGIDYGVHIVYRWDEELAKGYPALEAMQLTMASTGVDIFTGALSTSVAFWAVGFTDFRGIAELGIIAGTGVFLCYIAMVTVLPAFLFLARPEVGSARQVRPPRLLMRLEAWLLSRAWAVVVAGTALTLLCLSQLVYLRFDYNLLSMQAPNLDSVQSELRLIHVSERSVLSGASLADGVEEARRLSREFEKLPTVSRVESVVELIPANFEEKTPYMAAIQEILQEVVPPPLPSEPADAGNLKDMAGGFLDLERAFREAYPSLLLSDDPETRKQAGDFKQLLERLFSTLEKMGPGPIEDGLTTFQRLFFEDLGQIIGFLKAQKPGKPVGLEALPENLTARSVGKSGKILLRIYPHANVWEREPLERFVTDLLKVDPDAIGSPVMMLHHTVQLKRAFETSGTYAFLAICLLLAFHFRSFQKAFLALLPLLVGVSWMLGAMVYFGVDFNLANFMGLPMILGVGLDYGIHVVHRELEEGSPGIFSNCTGPATVLCGLTTVAGFGTLTLAHHQGIASLGFVLTTGIVSIMIASIVLLPAILRLLRKG
ncbi:MAG: MMPL family transporter [Armatimonadetes bacterium]|nr:MMPL family transporter [Armatimonadota bacterium]